MLTKFADLPEHFWNLLEMVSSCEIQAGLSLAVMHRPKNKLFIYLLKKKQSIFK